MGPIGLARWQWEDYALAHASKRNLAIHAVAVPLFMAGNVVSVVGIALVGQGWVTGLALLLAGLGLSAGAMAWQGKGHAQEEVPPKPFTGPMNVVGRIFTEQWFTFWRFVFTGGWRRAWKAA